MEPTEYLRALQRRWLLIIVLTVLGAIAGYGYALTVPNSYESSSSVFVTANQSATDNQALYQGNQYSQAAVQSYVQLGALPAVLDPVSSKLKLGLTAAQLAHQVELTANLDTTIVTITATDTDPARAQAIAQATAASLVTEATKLAPKANGVATLKLTVVQNAALPAGAVSPNRPLSGVLGAIAGLVLALAYAIARGVLDTKVSDADDIARVTETPVLGEIGIASKRTRSALALRAAPLSTLAEGYRRLRTNLEFANVDSPTRTVVVTSGSAGEGKSTTAANLALAIAEQGHSVVLVDADLRRPRVAEYAGIEGGVGVTSVLRGKATVSDAVQRLGDSGLDVLPAGAVPPNPNQIISSTAMADLVRDLGEQYDYVILDAPPVLLVTDALVLSGLADGTLVVAQSGRTKRPDLVRTLEALRLVNEPAFGLVLNQSAQASKTEYYGYADAREDAPAASSTVPTAPASPTAARAARPEVDAAPAREERSSAADLAQAQDHESSLTKSAR